MQWGASDENGAWSSFCELVPPFIPSTGTVCGNLDVVLTRPGSRDVVVEIDSTNKDRSMEKLRFAHRAGGPRSGSAGARARFGKSPVFT
jgi:hypothetical protein